MRKVNRQEENSHLTNNFCFTLCHRQITTRFHSQLIKCGSLVGGSLYKTMTFPSSISFACTRLRDQVRDDKYATPGHTFKIQPT